MIFTFLHSSSRNMDENTDVSSADCEITVGVICCAKRKQIS